MRRRQPYLVDTSTQFVHFRCGCGKVCVPEGGRNHSPRTRDLHTASDASKRERARGKQAAAPQMGGVMAWVRTSVAALSPPNLDASTDDWIAEIVISAPATPTRLLLESRT